MKHHCLRNRRTGNRAPFLRAMMRQDHVDQLLHFLFVVIVPDCEALDQRRAHVQMSEQHSAGCERGIAVPIAEIGCLGLCKQAAKETLA